MNGSCRLPFCGPPDQAEEVDGEQVIGELMERGMVLIPFAVDPHGRWGPMMHNFLFRHVPRAPIRFGRDKPRAAAMHDRATSWSCPAGIAADAKHRWRSGAADKPFYGHSHTAPTPREYTLQQLGLVIVKAMAVHLRNAKRKLGPHPRGGQAARATGKRSEGRRRGTGDSASVTSAASR